MPTAPKPEYVLQVPTVRRQKLSKAGQCLTSLLVTGMFVKVRKTVLKGAGNIQVAVTSTVPFVLKKWVKARLSSEPFK